MTDDVGVISGGWAKFEWKIDNLRKQLKNVHPGNLSSPIFRYDMTSWYLEIQPNEGKGNGDVLELFLFRTNSRYTESMDYRLVFLRPDGSEQQIHQESVYFQPGKFTCGPVELFDAKQLREWGKSDALTVLCYMWRDDSDDESDSDESTDDEDIEIREKGACTLLHEHLKNMLVTGEDHDVILRVSDRQFPTHRSILRARSSVLREILDQNKNVMVLDMEDCDPEAFEILLKFVYCAEVEDPSMDNVFPLFRVAHKYDFRLLRQKCLNLLERSLSPDVVFDVLRLAKEHNEFHLMDVTTRYFVSHRDYMLSRTEWLEYLKEDPLHANEIYKKIVETLKSVNELRELHIQTSLCAKMLFLQTRRFRTE